MRFVYKLIILRFKINFNTRGRMAKYLVETYYTCSFKVNHYLDDVNEAEIANLEKRDDGRNLKF